MAVVSAASLAIRILPFKTAVRLSSRREGKGDFDFAEAVSDVRWSIEVATRRLPWNPVCIQRALAMQWMLRRRGIDASLHYGLANESGSRLKAHVWVEASGERVIGGEDANEFVRVATFP
jgi:hypothetical protein